MNEFPKILEDLVEEFRQLPTIGKKTAQRLALFVVKRDADKVRRFANTLEAVKEEIHDCPVCGNMTQEAICPICSSGKRDHSTICVVEDVSNLLAMERAGSYQGTYFVLKGLLSPMNEMGPDKIGVEALLDRIHHPTRFDPHGEPIREVIFAISPTVEGETTMLFLGELLKKEPVKLSRIASGIPVGGSLEYYDELTLSKALEDRRGLED